jgi:CubicO group peptidase (beta-lactamase class C family)
MLVVKRFMLKSLIGGLGVFLANPAMAQALDPATTALIARVEADVPQMIVSQLSPRESLRSLMQAQQIPGVSVAVYRDGTLAWSRGWGVTDVDRATPVTPATLFQAASISKPVAALGAMNLVAQGKLALDNDISQSITGWRAAAPITLRQVLSHSTGLSVSGFQGYAAGLPIPTELQILNGQAPANSAPVRLEGQPGVAFNYSGGGYTVLQTLIGQTAGVPFSNYMQSAILSPLGMTESQFSQPLPAAFQDRAASGHQNGKVIAGRFHTYPELAAAGLWTTPRDLAKIGVEVQNAARGQGLGIVTPQIATSILTPQIGGYGLGFALETHSNEAIFKHSGLNEGFETLLVASASVTGPRTVVVVMTNGQGGSRIAGGLVRAIAREYDWKAFAPQRVQETKLSLAQLRRFEGFYRGGDQTLALEVVDGILHVRDGNWQRAPMLATGPAEFAVQNRPFSLRLIAAAPNQPLAMTLVEGTSMRNLTRIEKPFTDAGGQPPLLRGSMNNWGDQNAFVEVRPKRWRLTTTLPIGRFEFKIATADWNALNLGGRLGLVETKLETSNGLAPVGENLQLNITEAGTYVFEIDAREERRPLLKVSQLNR